MVSIQKFRIILLVSNRIEYWSNYSIRFEISNTHTALKQMPSQTIAEPQIVCKRDEHKLASETK